jgi:hypothetical protein
MALLTQTLQSLFTLDLWRSIEWPDRLSLIVLQALTAVGTHVVTVLWFR